MSGAASHLKRALRAELREQRRVMSPQERDESSGRISRHLIDLSTSRGARTLSAYLPAPNEPDIRPFLAWALKQGITVLLPISREDGLLDWVAGNGSNERIGRYGMPEAIGEPLGPAMIESVDLVVVPAASVDRSGMRMGWGRGYFDRALGSMEKSPPVYAVIFDRELVDAVPTEVHDRGVDGVVTPSAIIDFPRH